MTFEIPKRAVLRPGIATMIVFLMCNTAIAADDPSWLCVADAANGFSFQRGAWQPTTFNVKDKRYLLSKGTDFRSTGYRWKEFGSSNPGKVCAENRTGGYVCGENDLPAKTVFDQATLRYMTVYPYGYLEGEDNNADTPHIEIGRCSRL